MAPAPGDDDGKPARVRRASGTRRHRQMASGHRLDVTARGRRGGPPAVGQSGTDRQGSLGHPVKHFVTADEIRQLAASGERELMLREHTVLTDAAVDAVRLHGIRLVEGSTYSTSGPPPEVVPAPPQAGGLPAPALAGLVRDRPTVTKPAPPRAAQSSGTVPVTGPPDANRLHTRLLIGGEWVEATGGATVPT